jgi:hypothetical protein
MAAIHAGVAEVAADVFHLRAFHALKREEGWIRAADGMYQGGRVIAVSTDEPFKKVFHIA